MNKILIPVYEPRLNGNEKTYVMECLDSGWISSKGKFVNEFSEKFATYIGGGYSSTCCNGTVALHLALLAVDIKPRDKILVPSFTYVASVNAIMMCNASPIFVDSSTEDLQIDLDDLEKKITPDCKAIMIPHMYGMMADIDRILAITKRHKLLVIEDCAESFGSYYKGKHSGLFGDISTFSFFGNKTITTGEGGMVHSMNQDLIHKVNHLKAQGLSSLNMFDKDDKEYWHDIVGYNYRMTNITAAIGIAQLEQADKIIADKIKLADLYYQYIDPSIARVLRPNDNVKSAYWMVTILFKNEHTKDKARELLNQNGVETRPIFPLVNTMPMYKNLNQNSFPNAEKFSKLGINLPSFPNLNEEQIVFISKIINECM